MWNAKTLLITDPNLGEVAHRKIASVASDLTWLSWDYGDNDRKNQLLEEITGKSWDLAVSFYSDLVLPDAALHAIALPINFHPALPAIRGVGHDIVPLLEGHETVGATMHRMDHAIDTGTIYDVLEVPMPSQRERACLRKLNQNAVLELLDRFCALLPSADSVARLEQVLLGKAGSVPHRWGDYYSRKAVSALTAKTGHGPVGD